MRVQAGCGNGFQRFLKAKVVAFSHVGVRGWSFTVTPLSATSGKKRSNCRNVDRLGNELHDQKKKKEEWLCRSGLSGSGEGLHEFYMYRQLLYKYFTVQQLPVDGKVDCRWGEIFQMYIVP